MTNTLKNTAIDASIMLREGGMFKVTPPDEQLSDVYQVDKLYLDKILHYIDTLPYDTALTRS